MAKRRSFDWNSVNDKIKELDKKPQYGNSGDDDVFYKPKTDEQGNGNVLIRFLPPHPEETLPFVKKYNHGFQSANGWFIEDCPTSIGEKCPICTYNGTQWDIDQTGVRNRKRKVSFYSNILIVKDPLAPENEGKVFKYRYGIKIHGKLMEKIAPESTIDDPVNIFDYDNGANFKLKIKTQKIFLGGKERPVPNYDASSFSEPSPIALKGANLTDDEINALDDQLNKIETFTEKSNFKDYKTLAELFFKKTGIEIPTSPDGKVSAPAPRAAPVQTMSDFSDTPAESATAKSAPVDSSGSEDESDDDFFAKLRENS